MTFKEALTFKKNIKSPYIHIDTIMTVYVAPDNHDDFMSFLDYYSVNKTTDETAKLFSSNSIFAVYGIGPRIVLQFYIKLS